MERVQVIPELPTEARHKNGNGQHGPALDGARHGAHGPAVRTETGAERITRQEARTVAVVPAYNEDRFIGSVLLKIRPYVDWSIVIDDGSTDRTADVAREAGAEVIVHCVNQGKARALETGFARALELGADAVVILDADGQHDPAEIPIVVAPVLADEADMVIGSRFLQTKSDIPAWRLAGQYVLTTVTNVASGVPTSDSQSGFRAFRAQALRTLSIRAGGFAIESELQFWAGEQGLRVVEAPISVVYAEPPKRNPVMQALQVLNGVFALVSQSRPLLFFGLSGLLITLLGIGFWYRILQTYRLSGDLELVSVVLGTLLVMLGVLATFQGITLHTMRRVMLLQAWKANVPTSLRGDCPGPQPSAASEYQNIS